MTTSSNWYDALSLVERAKLWNGASPPVTARAEKRLAQLRDDFPLNAAEFSKRLAIEGLDDARLLALLSTPPEKLSAKEEPPLDWSRRLREVYAADAREPIVLPEPMRAHKMAGLLEATAPLLAAARHRFDAALAELLLEVRAPSVPFSSELLRDELYAPLPATFLRCIVRTLTLELHVARMSGALAGDTPQSRYQEFIARLSDPERALALWSEYPVLGRSLAEAAERWHEVMIELAGRLLSDWPVIVETLFVGVSPGPLLQVQADAGDTHRGGRSVMVLTFESGTKLVYKPRSLAVDIRFQELLVWLNTRGAEPQLKTLRVIDRGDHGWAEFISYQECTDRSQAERFFQRQGAYLALFHALQGTDVHYENLIACGEHPMPVDLETLFQPRAELELAGSELAAAQKMADSVLRVGLLPNRRYTDSEEEEVDISGLMPVEGQLTPQKLHFFTGAGTDELRMERRRLPMGEGNNLPRVNGVPLNVIDYEEQLVRGFEKMYQLIARARDELLAGPLARFEGVAIRIILRPTRVYATLLRESFHPDLLRDAIDRDRLFDKLWETVEIQPLFRRAIPSELAELRAGDIPLFWSTPESCALFDGQSRELPDFFDESGLSRSRNRILGFSEEDLRQQLWFVRASLATVAMGLEEETKWNAHHFRADGPEATRAELLENARAVGDRLVSLAIAGAHDVTWIGVAMNHKKWLLAPLKNELYAGLPGVVFFLAYLGEITQDRKYTDLAVRGYETLAAQIAAEKEHLFSPGLFGGWAGIIYLYVHLAALWDRPLLLEDAERLTDKLMPLVAEDSTSDLTYGAAGAISGLLALHAARPSQRILELAVSCGDVLLAHARPLRGGLGWIIPAAGNQALAGFSHGAAGIAFSLSHLALATGETRFLEGARGALTFERGVYSPELKNWPDLRTPELPNASDEPHALCAWCHGAAGIGIGRIGLAGFDGDAAVEAEINVAVETTRRIGFGGNHSLCHGDLGNLELLLLAARHKSDAALRSETYRRARVILESISKHGWLSGVPLAVETPGLMNGLSGIGHGLLRLAEPEAVPSLLLVEGPRAKRGRASWKA